MMVNTSMSLHFGLLLLTMATETRTEVMKWEHILSLAEVLKLQKTKDQNTTVVLEEYNKAGVFLSRLNNGKNQLNYCKKPFGHIHSNSAQLVVQTTNLQKIHALEHKKCSKGG